MFYRQWLRKQENKRVILETNGFNCLLKEDIFSGKEAKKVIEIVFTVNENNKL